MPDVQLKVNGLIFTGWTSMRLERGIEQCSGMFELGITNLWPEGESDTESAHDMVPGDKCTVLIEGAPVITGYVDGMTLSYSSSKHDVSIQGRDLTADLVDCSAIKTGGQWNGLKLEQIAADLCKPFGINVFLNTDTGKAFPNFALQQGETVFEAIERMARIRAVLVTSDGLGNLVITRASKERVFTTLKRGVNILEASGTLDWKERFSDYIVKGQAAAAEFFNGKAASQMQALAKDPKVSRKRPLIVLAEGQDEAVSLKDRAIWEAAVRAARSNDITIKVQGWSHADGIWEPNRLVHVTDDWLRLDSDLLIKKVSYSLDVGGTFTELQLTWPGAFTLLPLKDTQVDLFKWDSPKP